MRKGIMSLEDLDGSVDVLETSALDLAVAEGEAETSGIENALDQVAETGSISDSVDSLTAQVEAKVEDGEGISEETARALEVAVEHFKTRLGYTKKMIPAMEGFADPSSRLGKTKITLENLKVLQTGLRRNLKIATESAVENAFNKFDSNSDLADKLLTSLKRAETDFLKSGSKPEGTVLKNHDFAKRLGGSGDEAVASLKKIANILSSSTPHTLIKSLKEDIDKAIKAIKTRTKSDKSDFHTKENSEKLADVLNKVNRALESSNYSNEITTASKANVVALEREISQIIGDVQKLSEELGELKKSLESLRTTVKEESTDIDEGTRKWLVGLVLGTLLFGPIGSLIGYFIGKNSDAKTATARKDSLSNAKDTDVEILPALLRSENDLIGLCNTAINYIEASTA